MTVKLGPSGVCEGKEWSLLLEFDTDSPEFRRGFETATLWAQMNDLWSQVFGRVITADINQDGAEMVMRMCEALGWGFAAEFSGGRMKVTLTPPGSQNQTDL